MPMTKLDPLEEDLMYEDIMLLQGEIRDLKGELAQCRELSDLRLQSEQKLKAERDGYKSTALNWAAEHTKMLCERDQLRAALEEIIDATKKGLAENLPYIRAIARRTLEGK